MPRGFATSDRVGTETARRLLIAAPEPLMFRPAPHNLEAEQALLGAILVNNEALDRVSGFLTPEHFYEPLHATIFETLATLIHAGNLATPITVKSFFETAEPIDAHTSVPQYLGRLAANATTVINAAEYGRTVCELATRRKLILLADDLARAAYDGDPKKSSGDILAQHETALGRLINSGSVGAVEQLIEFAENAAIEDGIEDVVQGLIPAGGVGLLYGPSGLGKTFIAIHLAESIAKGAPFFGRRARAGANLYVALEGRGRFGRRLAALVRSGALPSRRVATLLKNITLGRGDGADAGVSTIIDAASRLAKAAGLPVALIVIDTLARALAGDNENEAGAVSSVINQAARIASKTGAAVLIIHHPGKDADRGMRGSSSLFADADFVLRIDGEKGLKAKLLTVEKSKDGEEGPVGDFNLEKIILGNDRHGDAITSMIVRPVNGLTHSSRKPKRPAPESQTGRALNELEQLLAFADCKTMPNHPRIPPNVSVVSKAAWRDACRRKQLSAEGSDEAEKKAFSRGHEAMSRDGLIGSYGGWVWLIGDMPEPQHKT